MSDVLVVGAGQLGLMMAAAGARFGISVDRVDHVTGEVLAGTSRTRMHMKLEEVVDHYKVITAELEHLLGNEIVEGLRDHTAWINGDAMHLLPARDQQKGLLDQLDVATSPWQKIDQPDDLDAAQVRLGAELVVKSIRDGYDGKGQWVLGGEGAVEIPETVFGRVIAERKINFSRELSLVGARFADGQCCFYPLVENYHQAGMLRYTLAPARDSGSLQEEAENMLRTVMESLNYVGVMAMECFDSEFGLMVNELAPRVHNSGHWTQAGMRYSQFDLHLFAILDHAVQPPEHTMPYSMMLNLIGCEWNADWFSRPGIQCWWYGKSWRENRKLGHINMTGQSPGALVENCVRLLPTLDRFHQQMLELAIKRLQESAI